MTYINIKPSMEQRKKLELLRDKVLQNNTLPLKPSDLVKVIQAKSKKEIEKLLKKYLVV